MVFRDRAEAGRRLAPRVAGLGLADPLVLGLPRGGVPVAYEVAVALHAPLDVLVVRKIGAPWQPELAMGALAPDGLAVWNRDEMETVGVTQEELQPTVAREARELERRAAAYRAGQPPLEVAGRTVVVVDDGLATGATARAALRWVRAKGAARAILAVPVATVESVERLAGEADQVVAVETPPYLGAVGAAYDDFEPVPDEVVVALLARARAARPAAPAGAAPAQRPRAAARGALRIPARDATIDGDLSVPQGARGLVVFAHGSGSGRHSPRNQAVARALEAAGLATLLLDLLTAEEGEEDERTARLRFDVHLLARRVEDAVAFVAQDPRTRGLPVGLFGASTGAAAALLAAASRPDSVGAVVSRGGRPDLAGAALPHVKAPTLLVVGGADEEVLQLNREAASGMACERRIEVVPGATHLFPERGALEEVERLARDWFLAHLAGASAAAGRSAAGATPPLRRPREEGRAP